MKLDVARVLDARALVPLGLGLLVGFGIAVSPALPAVSLGAALAALVGLVAPWVLVGGMYVAMLFDQMGITGMKVASLPVTASKLAVVGSLGLWALHAVLFRAPPLRWHRVLTGLCVIVAAMCISIANTGRLGEGIYDFAGMAMLTVLVALVYAILAEAPLQGLYRLMAVVLIGSLAATVVSIGGSEAGRAAGTFGDPNEWGTIVLLLTPFLLGGLAMDAHWSAPSLRLGLMLLAPVGIVLCRSRAAFLVGVLLVPACLYLVRARRSELMVGALAAVIAMPMFTDLDAAVERYKSLLTVINGAGVVEDYSLTERTELARQGRELFLDNPILGVGPGNFGPASGFVSREGGYRPAHNTYLQIASEQGIVGLLAFGFFVLTVLETLRGGLRRAGYRSAGRARILGVAFGLAAAALMAATLGLLTMSMIYLVLGFGLAAVRQIEVADTRAEEADASPA